MSAALDSASIKGSAGAPAGLAALAASLLPAGRPARKGSYSGLQQRPGAGAQPQPPRRRAAHGVPAGSKMRGKEEKSSLKGGFTAPHWQENCSPRGKEPSWQRCIGLRAGHSRGTARCEQRPGDLARAAEPVQKDPRRAGAGVAGWSRGACGRRGGPRLSRQWVSASGKLCRTERGLCWRLPASWESLASVHSWQERAGGHRRVAWRCQGAAGRGLW